MKSGNLNDSDKLIIALQWIRECKTFINVNNNSDWSKLLLTSLDNFMLSCELDELCPFCGKAFKNCDRSFPHPSNN